MVASLRPFVGLLLWLFAECECDCGAANRNRRDLQHVQRTQTPYHASRKEDARFDLGARKGESSGCVRCAGGRIALCVAGHARTFESRTGARPSLRFVETSVWARTMESVMESHGPLESFELSIVRIGLQTTEIRVDRATQGRFESRAHSVSGRPRNFRDSRVVWGGPSSGFSRRHDSCRIVRGGSSETLRRCAALVVVGAPILRARANRRAREVRFEQRLGTVYGTTAVHL